jgi:dihydroorotate dehydrogenase electron transfer subunit
MVDAKPVLIQARITANNPVMPGVFQLKLRCPEIVTAARPGQFVMIKCGADRLLRRPISISGTDIATGEISLLIAAVGKGTDWLAQRTTGEHLDVLGPLGQGFSLEPGADKVLLIGGGMGIAPLNFLAEQAAAMGKAVTLVLGARTGAMLCPASHLPEVNERVLCTEDASVGIKGRVTECPDDYIAAAAQIFACGPLPMYRALAKDPRFNSGNIQVSLEVRMACGTGLCYGCTINTRGGLRQVCRHGPVFNMNDILWEELADL